MTRSEESTNARHEDVIRTDTQCIFPPPSPANQCWFSSMSRLPPTLNSRGAGFINVHVKYLALKQRGLFFGFTGFGFVYSKAFCQPPITYGSLPAPASVLHTCVSCMCVAPYMFCSPSVCSTTRERCIHRNT